MAKPARVDSEATEHAFVDQLVPQDELRDLAEWLDKREPSSQDRARAPTAPIVPTAKQAPDVRSHAAAAARRHIENAPRRVERAPGFDRRPDPRHHSAPNGAPDAIADPETLAHLLRDVEQADPGLKTVKSGDAVGRSSEPRPLPKRASTAAKDKLPRMTYSPADVIDRAKTAMPGHRTSGEKEIHFAAAPLWRRMLATVVDGALVGGLMYLPIREGWLGPVVQNIRVWEPDDIGRALFNGDLTLVIVLTAVVIILLGAVPHGLAGRSLGKLITGLTLVNNWTGEKPSWVQVMLRQLVGIVTTMVGFATYLWFIVDRRSSALHDRLAGTSCVISSSRSIR